MGKTYFLPPDFWSYPAAQDTDPGAIQLGHLIGAIDDPGHPVGTLPPLDMTNYKITIRPLSTSKVGHREISSSSYLADLFLKAVSALGAKLKVQVQHSESLLSTIAELKATTIDPIDTYVKDSLAQEAVQAWLKDKWPRRRIFMVTGLLVATPND
ncbi:hypothetical protein V8F33_002757 [Rhypophila sp. PSN 637]